MSPTLFDGEIPQAFRRVFREGVLVYSTTTHVSTRFRDLLELGHGPIVGADPSICVLQLDLDLEVHDDDQAIELAGGLDPRGRNYIR